MMLHQTLKIRQNKRVIARHLYRSFPLKDQISESEFTDILAHHNEAILNMAIETGLPVKLPYGIGAFAIGKRKNRYGAYDAETWLENLKNDGNYALVKKFNYHTEGYVLQILHSYKHFCNIKGYKREMFKFRAVGRHRKEFSVTIKRGINPHQFFDYDYY